MKGCADDSSIPKLEDLACLCNKRKPLPPIFVTHSMSKNCELVCRKASRVQFVHAQEIDVVSRGSHTHTRIQLEINLTSFLSEKCIELKKLRNTHQPF